MSREELKVTIIIKGDSILLGAQATGCDFKMKTAKGNLDNALGLIPNFIAEANRQWDANPHNPRSTIPEPVLATAAPAQQSSTPTVKKSETGQQRFF